MLICDCGRQMPVCTLYRCLCGKIHGKGMKRGSVVVSHALPPQPPVQTNPWSLIHSRYAAAIQSQIWDEVIERNWLDCEFSKLVPCSSCGSKWLSLAATLDLSSAESAFRTLWAAHNTVSTQHVQPPLPAMPYDQCRALWLGPKVAFIAVNYAAHGGTETFHQTLLPRLRHYRNVIGFGAIHGGGDPALLKVPYVEGRDAIAKLCKEADVVITWGIDALTSLLPSPRPKVIAVHHGDRNAGWIGETVWQAEVDEFVCVNRAAADYIRSVRKLPVHWIPNAIDLSRIKPTRRVDTEGKRIVLFGHRMSEEKRPELAVEIAKLLPDGWLMVMAGDGPRRPADIPGNVRMVGQVPTLANWLAVADCFLSLSTFEGFGLSMAEAHAAGVPIVATPVGVAPQIAATILPIEASPYEWANSIVSCVLNGEQNAEADFSVESHVAQWVETLS